MVLIDTPGINTLIERHEQLLAQSLARASSIVYVMRGTPAAVDIEKLELLAHGGRPISLVRTHCDEINEAEEGYADVVAHDESILVDFGIREKIEGCFYLSNLKDTPYFAGIARLRNLLAAKGADVRRSLAVDTELYLRATAGGVIAALGEMEEILAVGQAERAAEIAQKRKSLDEEVAHLTETLDVRRAHVKKKAAGCRQKMERGIRKEIRTAAHQAAERIAAAGEETATDEQMKALLQQEMRHVLRHIYDRISELAAPLLKEINSFELPHGDALPVIDLPETEHYASIVAEQNGAIEDLRREFAVMQANRDEIEMQLMQYDAATLEAMQGELRSLEEELVRISDAYQELGPYIPQMIEVDPGDASGAALGKTIGNILDWAMILIPGPTQAKGAGNIAAKAPKAIEAANQTVSVAAKCRRVLAKAAEAGKKQRSPKNRSLRFFKSTRRSRRRRKTQTPPHPFLTTSPSNTGAGRSARSSTTRRAMRKTRSIVRSTRRRSAASRRSNSKSRKRCISGVSKLVSLRTSRSRWRRAVRVWYSMRRTWNVRLRNKKKRCARTAAGRRCRRGSERVPSSFKHSCRSI